jgi:NAD(P)-dependent dehydrogenase (short-subunit alcohol dehydrogenase family)|tara:strand:+ start:1059 stop:1859 length:801 start_codon:yes stop_codon:yes gene_type:complete
VNNKEKNMLLRDKVIVISGVGPGLGQTLAKMAAQEGASVVLGARSQDFLDAVAEEIRAGGGKAVALSTDVTSTDQCQALVEAGVEAFGRIDGLVNSAYAHGDWATADVSDPDKMGDVINVICQGALRMAQACAPHMQATGGGSIVNVSTMSTVKPFAGETMYAAGKGALNALTRHMANDFGKFSIRVNALRMGWIGGAPVYAFIDSQVAAGADRDTVVSSITDRIPLGVIPPEGDCAKAVLAFLSDYSAVITGSSVDVNGGEYMAP